MTSKNGTDAASMTARVTFRGASVLFWHHVLLFGLYAVP